MFHNKLKTDAVAEAVAKIIGVEEELKGNQHKIDANKNGKIDGQDFDILRKKKGMKKEETEAVEEGWDDMLKAVKDKNKPQPSGGSGIKKGTRYGGSKQKDEPEKDDEDDKMKKEEVELDEAKKPMSQAEKDRVTAGVRAAMQKSHDNVMKGRADLAAAKAKARALARGDEAEKPMSQDGKSKVVSGVQAAMKKSHDNVMKGRAERAAARLDAKVKYGVKEDVEQVDEVSPPGFKGTVKAMKKHKEIDNPFALAWYMKNKGAKSNYKADGTKKNEEVDSNERTKDMISGRKPTTQRDDVGPGADGKSTKVKFRGGPMSGD